MSLKRGIDTEYAVHYIVKYYRATKNNGFMKFTGKWMELENVILSEVTQSHTHTQKTHGIYSLISGY